jgi:LAS superfamily LD-carboxypeptidase LdcB
VGRAPELMVVLEPEGVSVHREVVPELLALRAAAAADGIVIEVASGFRDFERQLAIWNEKARGERPLLDAEERSLSLQALTPEQRMFAILRWSALPGASRHHWGTELDVFDRAALGPGVAPSLRRDDAAAGATFGRLHAWLDAHLHRFGFFRPYDRDRGGVGPEPWHLSHVHLARPLQAAHSVALLERVLRAAELDLKEQVLRHLDAVYSGYVVNVSAPPAP